MYHSHTHCCVERAYGKRGIPGQATQGPQGPQGSPGPDGPNGPSAVPFVEATMGNVEQPNSFSYPVPQGTNTITFPPIFTSDISYDASNGTFTILTEGVYRFVVLADGPGNVNARVTMIGVSVNGTVVMSMLINKDQISMSMLPSSLYLYPNDVVSFIGYNSGVITIRLTASNFGAGPPYEIQYRLTVAYFYRML